MTVLWILLGSLGLFGVGGWWYGGRISRAFGEEVHRPTPAVALEDGLDYVPTNTGVVFAHHFASIAGAGPIVGPVIGVVFGWLPALVWVVVGAVFAGAVHDYGAMFVSVREKGKSIAVIARNTLGRTTFLLFIFLLIVLMVLVTAMFLILSAQARMSTVDARLLGLAPDNGYIEVDAEGQAQIGGIATMSVIIITATAPLMGWLYLRKKVPVMLCSLLALGVCAGSVAAGVYLPLRIPSIGWLEALGVHDSASTFWMLCVSGYCLLAAGLPVWLFLQSRDFINVHILYIGIVVLFVALLSAGLQGARGDFAMYRGLSVEIPAGGQMESVFIWPFLFITIACGACSGFHSLCASGTTAKQLNSERAIRRVGFYAMLLEGFLAVCVIAACMVGLSQSEYASLMLDPAVKANPVLTFAIAVGNTVHAGLGLPVAAGAVFGMLLLEGFLLTTLDTAIRLSRYLLEEAWATLFARYDVFADRARAEEARSARVQSGDFEDARHNPELELAGAAGLETSISVPRHRPADQVVKTTGLGRAALTLIGHYWCNTTVMVILMFWLAKSGHVLTLWALFGAGNQLLAGLSFVVVSAWLLIKGRSLAYTLVPAFFMLVTTLTMLVMFLVDYVEKVTTGAPGNWMPLLIADILILALTSAILIQAVRRFGQVLSARRVRPAVPAATVSAS